MSEEERRRHPRYNACGLKAAINLGETHTTEVLYGEVVDISLSGIKIQLDKPRRHDLEDVIKIDLFLPETEIPLSVNGALKYMNDANELGVHYLEYPIAETLNNYMFACMKLAKSAADFPPD